MRSFFTLTACIAAFLAMPVLSSCTATQTRSASAMETPSGNVGAIEPAAGSQETVPHTTDEARATTRYIELK